MDAHQTAIATSWKRPRWLIAAAAVVLVLALAFAALRQRGGAAAAAEDCEDKPPKVEFAVAECDAAPAAGAAGAEGRMKKEE